MSKEAAEKSAAFQKEAFSLINSLSKPSNAQAAAQLRSLLPSADEIFGRYRNLISAIPADIAQAQKKNIAERIEKFCSTRIHSLDVFYTKTYNQLLETANHLDEQIDKLAKEQKKTSEGAKTVLDSLLADQKKIIDRRLEQKHHEHEILVENLKGRIAAAENSMQERIEKEAQKITEHFEKQLNSKLDSLEMSRAATNKATEDLNSIVSQREAEVAEIAQRNSEILKKHKESMDEKLQPSERLARSLKAKYDQLQKSHSDIGPALEEQWRSKQEAQQKKFDEMDTEFNEAYHAKEEELSFLEKRIEETQAEIDKYQDETNSVANKRREEHENNYIYVLGRHDLTIELNRAITLEQLQAKYDRMETSLSVLKNTMREDRDEFERKVTEKKEEHEQKIELIKEEHKKEMELVENSISDLNNQIADTKERWKEERVKINEQFDNDIVEVKKQIERDERYFKAKMDVLRKELARVIEENKDVIGDIETVKKQYAEEEKHVNTQAREEMNKRVQASVDEKMKAIKEKHRAELETIRPKNQKMRDSEVVKKLNDIIDMPLDKWRTDYFADRRNLKREESEALKQLDETRESFLRTAERTKQLKEQLENASRSYEAALQKRKDETSDNIKQLNEDVQAREKLIMQLEEKFKSNEQEVHRKLVQIEQAEDKINVLHEKLDNEKKKILAIIQKEYQPLITQEQEKSYAMGNEMEKLRNDLELNIEYIQNDLYGVEASNAALEDDLSAETESIVQRVKTQLNEEFQAKEEIEVNKLNNEELDQFEKSTNEVEALKKETEEKKDKVEKNFAEVKESYKESIDELNDECIEVLTIIGEKKKKIKFLLEKPCDKCPLLEKNIRKLEKALIKMQYEDRGLVLDEKNKTELYNTFHKRTALPPLPPK